MSAESSLTTIQATSGAVGIGITTMNRPEYLEKVAKSYKRHLFLSGSPVFWKLAVYNDGSDQKHHGAYERAYKQIRGMGGRVIDNPVNVGVAKAKNALIEHLLADPVVKWVIIAEDDILVKDFRAVTEYVRIAQQSGLSHFSFAHHGPANVGVPLEEGDVSFFPHAMAAWSLYSRECLEKVGLHDTNFHNAFMDVELSLRLAMAGYTTGAYQWIDCTRSAEWLEEIPGCMDNSVVRANPQWQFDMQRSLQYWHDEKRESFDVMFGPGKPLEAWVQQYVSEA